MAEIVWRPPHHMKPTVFNIEQVRFLLALVEIPEAIECLCEDENADIRGVAALYRIATEVSEILYSVLPSDDQELFRRDLERRGEEETEEKGN